MGIKVKLSNIIVQSLNDRNLEIIPTTAPKELVRTTLFTHFELEHARKTDIVPVTAGFISLSASRGWSTGHGDAIWMTNLQSITALNITFLNSRSMHFTWIENAFTTKYEDYHVIFIACLDHYLMQGNIMWGWHNGLKNCTNWINHV